MRRRDHLGEEALAAFAVGERRPSSAESRHLEECRSCARRLAADRALLRALARGAEAPPPAPLLERAEALLGRLGRAEATPARLLAERRPGATLEAPPGLRAASPPACQWVFAAGGREVDVQAFPEGPEECLLVGQVQDARGPVAGAPVHLRHDGPPAMAVTDGHGEFSLGPARGAASLVLETDAGLHRLDLGPVTGSEEKA